MPFHNDDPKPLSLLQRILAGYTPNWRANLDAPPVEERGPDHRELRKLIQGVQQPADVTRVVDEYGITPQPTIGPADPPTIAAQFQEEPTEIRPESVGGPFAGPLTDAFISAGRQAAGAVHGGTAVLHDIVGTDPTMARQRQEDWRMRDIKSKPADIGRGTAHLGMTLAAFEGAGVLAGMGATAVGSRMVGSTMRGMQRALPSPGSSYTIPRDPMSAFKGGIANATESEIAAAEAIRLHNQSRVVAAMSPDKRRTLDALRAIANPWRTKTGQQFAKQIPNPNFVKGGLEPEYITTMVSGQPSSFAQTLIGVTGRYAIPNVGMAMHPDLMNASHIVDNVLGTDVSSRWWSRAVSNLGFTGAISALTNFGKLSMMNRYRMPGDATVMKTKPSDWTLGGPGPTPRPTPQATEVVTPGLAGRTPLQTAGQARLTGRAKGDVTLDVGDIAPTTIKPLGGGTPISPMLPPINAPKLLTSIAESTRAPVGIQPGAQESRLQVAIEKAPQEKATASQWLSMFVKGDANKGRPAVRQGELDVTGMQKLLSEDPKKMFTRDELLAYHDQNRLELPETRRAEGVRWKNPHIVEHKPGDIEEWLAARDLPKEARPVWGEGAPPYGGWEDEIYDRMAEESPMYDADEYWVGYQFMDRPADAPVSWPAGVTGYKNDLWKLDPAKPFHIYGTMPRQRLGAKETQEPIIEDSTVLIESFATKEEADAFLYTMQKNPEGIGVHSDASAFVPMHMLPPGMREQPQWTSEGTVRQWNQRGRNEVRMTDNHQEVMVQYDTPALRAERERMFEGRPGPGIEPYRVGSGDPEHLTGDLATDIATTERHIAALARGEEVVVQTQYEGEPTGVLEQLTLEGEQTRLLDLQRHVRDRPVTGMPFGLGETDTTIRGADPRGFSSKARTHKDPAATIVRIRTSDRHWVNPETGRKETHLNIGEAQEDVITPARATGYRQDELPEGTVVEGPRRTPQEVYDEGVVSPPRIETPLHKHADLWSRDGYVYNGALPRNIAAPDRWEGHLSAVRRELGLESMSREERADFVTSYAGRTKARPAATAAEAREVLRTTIRDREGYMESLRAVNVEELFPKYGDRKSTIVNLEEAGLGEARQRYVTALSGFEKNLREALYHAGADSDVLNAFEGSFDTGVISPNDLVRIASIAQKGVNPTVTNEASMTPRELSYDSPSHAWHLRQYELPRESLIASEELVRAATELDATQTRLFGEVFEPEEMATVHMPGGAVPRGYGADPQLRSYGFQPDIDRIDLGNLRGQESPLEFQGHGAEGYQQAVTEGRQNSQTGEPLPMPWMVVIPKRHLGQSTQKQIGEGQQADDLLFPEGQWDSGNHMVIHGATREEAIESALLYIHQEELPDYSYQWAKDAESPPTSLSALDAPVDPNGYPVGVAVPLTEGALKRAMLGGVGFEQGYISQMPGMRWRVTPPEDFRWPNEYPSGPSEGMHPGDMYRWGSGRPHRLAGRELRVEAYRGSVDQPYEWKPGGSVTRPEGGGTKQWDPAKRTRQGFIEGATEEEVMDTALLALSGSNVPANFPYQEQKPRIELIVKKAIAMAVEGGHDRVTWLSGEASADTYGVRNHAKQIEWRPIGGTEGELTVWGHNGATLSGYNGKVIEQDKLGEYIGAGPAKELIAKAARFEAKREEFLARPFGTFDTNLSFKKWMSQEGVWEDYPVLAPHQARVAKAIQPLQEKIEALEPIIKRGEEIEELLYGNTAEETALRAEWAELEATDFSDTRIPDTILGGHDLTGLGGAQQYKFNLEMEIERMKESAGGDLAQRHMTAANIRGEALGVGGAAHLSRYNQLLPKHAARYLKSEYGKNSAPRVTRINYGLPHAEVKDTNDFGVFHRVMVGQERFINAMENKIQELRHQLASDEKALTPTHSNREELTRRIEEARIKLAMWERKLEQANRLGDVGDVPSHPIIVKPVGSRTQNAGRVVAGPRFDTLEEAHAYVSQFAEAEGLAYKQQYETELWRQEPEQMSFEELDINANRYLTGAHPESGLYGQWVIEQKKYSDLGPDWGFEVTPQMREKVRQEGSGYVYGTGPAGMVGGGLTGAVAPADSEEERMSNIITGALLGGLGQAALKGAGSAGVGRTLRGTASRVATRLKGAATTQPPLGSALQRVGGKGTDAVRETTRRQLDEQFIRFDSSEHMDEFYGIEFGGEGQSSFRKTGHSGVQCTGFACAIQDKLGKGRVKVVGFSDEANPGTVFGGNKGFKEIAPQADGHDFAVLDDRYIIDPWLTEFADSKQGVFDLQDPGDAEAVRGIYGDPSRWESAGGDTRKVELPRSSWTITHENVSKDLQVGLFRATPKQYEAELTTVIERALSGGESGDLIVDLYNRQTGSNVKIVKREGEGIYEGVVSPNVLLEIEGADTEAIKTIMAYRGTVTGQAAEAAYSSASLSNPTASDLAKHVVSAEDNYAGIVLKGNTQKIVESLRANDLGATLDGDKVVVIDYGSGSPSDLVDKVDAAVNNADVTERYYDGFQGIYLGRELYAAATKGPEGFGELANIIDEHITPAYQGFANKHGFGAGSDLTRIQGTAGQLRAAEQDIPGRGLFYPRPETPSKSAGRAPRSEIQRRLSRTEAALAHIESDPGRYELGEDFTPIERGVFDRTGFDPEYRRLSGQPDLLPDPTGKRRPGLTQSLTHERVMNILDRQVRLGLEQGGRGFYNLDPIAQRIDGINNPLTSFEDLVAATSAGSVQNSVSGEIANGSLMNYARIHNIPYSEARAHYVAMHPNGPKHFLPDKDDGVPYKIFDRYRETGIINPALSNPSALKVPAYNRLKMGYTSPLTPMDTHEQTRALVPTGNEYLINRLTAAEYHQVSEAVHSGGASRMGILEGQYQAGGWIGGGPLTGLKTARGDYVQHFEDALFYHALGTGRDASPQGLNQLFEDVINGKEILIPWRGKGSPIRPDGTIAPLAFTAILNMNKKDNEGG